MLCAELVDDPDYPPVGGVASPKDWHHFPTQATEKGWRPQKERHPFA
jgi:hypothetical protein